MSNDDDLYNDLPDETTSDYIARIENELQTERKKNHDSEKLIKELTSEKHHQEKRISELEKKILDLGRNLSSLYRTAVAEIGRKDFLMNELRIEYDNLSFRRGENTRNNSMNCIRDKSRDHRSIREKRNEDGSRVEEKYKPKSRVVTEDNAHSKRLSDRRNKYEERLRIEAKHEKRSSSERNDHRSSEFYGRERHHRSRTKFLEGIERKSISPRDRVEKPFSVRDNPRTSNALQHDKNLEKQQKSVTRLMTMRTTPSNANRLEALFSMEEDPIPRDNSSSKQNELHKNQEKIQVPQVKLSLEQNELRSSQTKSNAHITKSDLKRNVICNSQSCTLATHPKPNSDKKKLDSIQNKSPKIPENVPNFDPNSLQSIQNKSQVSQLKPNVELSDHRDSRNERTLVQEKSTDKPKESPLGQEDCPKLQSKLVTNKNYHIKPHVEVESSSNAVNNKEPVNILSISTTNSSNKVLHKTPAKNLISEILAQTNGHAHCEAALFSMKKHSRKLLTPLKDTPDLLKEKFSQTENNKINAKIPMINEQRMLSPFKNVGIVEIISRCADELESSKVAESETVAACSVTVSEDIEHGVFSRKSRKRPRIMKIDIGVKKVATC